MSEKTSSNLPRRILRGIIRHEVFRLSDAQPHLEKKEIECQPATASQGGEKGWEKEDRSRILFPWEHLVRLRGNHAIDAKHYLAERDGAKCVFCDLLVRDIFTELEFDHIDGNNRNNRRWNLRLSHHLCNVAAYHSMRPALSTPEREGEKGADGYSNWRGSAPWNSREGEKHDVMRSRWDAWINDMKRGPFRGEGGFVRLRDLAAMAPRALGLGSSNTYRRFVEEDCFGGPLEKFSRDGVLCVRYRGLKRTDVDQSPLME